MHHTNLGFPFFPHFFNLLIQCCCCSLGRARQTIRERWGEIYKSQLAAALRHRDAGRQQREQNNLIIIIYMQVPKVCEVLDREVRDELVPFLESFQPKLWVIQRMRVKQKVAGLWHFGPMLMVSISLDAEMWVVE